MYPLVFLDAGVAIERADREEQTSNASELDRITLLNDIIRKWNLLFSSLFYGTI
jgi:hypothetical protein